jgi:putative phosphoesterase
MSSPLRILVLADTHNHLPANIETLAEAADEIWHLGDVCASSILETLERIGPPVTIVRGNCDSNFEWPLIVDLKKSGVRFRLVHIPPDRAPENIDVLLHGHTHQPRNERRESVLFLNPGCVTRPSRGAPASIANLEIAADGKLSWQTIKLR